MPKISEERREERREEIMAAAVRCFSRTGYHRTSMADIITESGLSAGAIYGYFPGKQDLILAVARSVLERQFGESAALGADRVLAPAQIAASLIEGVRAAVPTTMLLQVWSEATVNDDMRAMFQELLSTIRANIARLLERWASEFPDQVDGAPAVWAAKSAPVLIAVVGGFILQSTLVDGFDNAAFLRALPGLLKGSAGEQE